MIPATNTKLLASEDWKKVYQSFRSADFKSYDFETLRRTMISYLRENYPEEFNDFIDSSEYIALIDLIAYLGQNLSFRVDLNARENFLETAQRRDSILRLAQLISYSPARNNPANGFLKLTAIATSDNILDSNGVNLANTNIVWNDPTNPEWYQQFINIMNSAMGSAFGNPSDRKVIDGITTEQYRINSSNRDTPIFSFNKNINGVPMNFEIVPCTFLGKEFIYEEPPKPANQFSLIYKNDNQGSGSPNTGFFIHFRQGALSMARFGLDNPVPNEIVGINTPDINNTDVWLWQLDNNDDFDTLWTNVPSLIGNNIIYNSLNKNLRTIYAITSRDNDQIDLNFADGVFGDLPKGNFRLFYRQSSGLSYSIKPEQMSGVVIEIPYTNAVGQNHTMQLTMSLQYTVTNASGPESNASIQLRAPQSYYTQNRMITGEDYNISPLTVGTDVLKVKSINRSSSGISKYFELSDVTGSYSKTNIFANDGILYKEEKEETLELEFTSRNQVLAFIKNSLAPIVSDPSLKSFYLEKYTNPNLASLGLTWVEVNKTPGQSRGYFVSPSGIPSIGSFSEENLKYLQPGALVKFDAPQGKYFDSNNNLKNLVSAQVGFDIVKFVKLSKGKYSYNEYYVKTFNLLPLYTSNLFFGNYGGKDRYGLYRDPDYPGLKYWVDFALENGYDINTVKQYFFPGFGADEPRSATVNKTAYWSSTGVPITTNSSGELTEVPQGGRTYIWAKIQQVIGDGSNSGAGTLDDGTGPVIFYTRIPDGAIPVEVIPKYIDTLGFPIENEIANICMTQRNFGLSIDAITRTWNIIINSNLDIVNSFSLVNQNNYEDIGIDASWVIAFIWTGKSYQVRYRKLNYIFESKEETAFFADDTSINYDFTSNTVIKDKIDVLSVNTVNETSLGVDQSWQVDGPVVEIDGYIQPKKVKVSFFDSNNAGQIVDPESFDNIVQPQIISPITNFRENFVYFKKLADGQRYEFVNKDNFLAFPTDEDIPPASKTEGQLFYLYDPSINVVKYWNGTQLIYTDQYFAREGRSDLKFHYVHNSGKERRIDPSKTNLIDIYVLTLSYDNDFRSYLAGNSTAEPKPPTSQALEQTYGDELKSIKAISDEIIFHPVRYKILFGNNADVNLRAKFKAVKNSSIPTTDNDIKTRILAAINNFFALENWDFGQSFYFTELSTYVMNQLSPDITNFVIVPTGNNAFGSYFEISCQSNEIFISGATISDIEIIDAVTASQLKSPTTIVTTSGT